MRKIKSVIVFAIIGFLISFVFGLFSGKSILFILLEALIFAAAFGILGLGIDFLFDKFLMEDSSSEISSEIPTTNPAAGGNAEVKGQHVDLTIQDEELPDGTSQNHFVVNENPQMLNKSDRVQVPGNDSPASGNDSENAGFVPLKNFETISNISSQEAVSPDSVEPSSAPVQSFEDDKKLDVLPDMDNFNFGSSSAGSSEDDDTNYDDMNTGFSSSVGSSGKKTLEDVGIQDAALMAKAISSALSNEDS